MALCSTQPWGRLVRLEPVDVSENRSQGPPNRNPLAVAALAVSVGSVVFAYMPLAFFITVPWALVAMVLAVAARRAANHPSRRGRGREMATAAFFVGLFSLVIGLLFAIATWNATRLPPGSAAVPWERQLTADASGDGAEPTTIRAQAPATVRTSVGVGEPEEPRSRRPQDRRAIA